MSCSGSTSAFPPSKYATACRTGSFATGQGSFARRFQLEDRIAGGDGREPLDRRAGGDREIALHGHLEAIQVGLQHLRLLRVGKGPQPTRLAPHALAQRDLPAHARGSHPLRFPAPRHQEAPSAVLEDVDRRRVEPAALSAAHLQQVVVGERETEADEYPEETAEDALEWRGHVEASRL